MRWELDLDSGALYVGFSERPVDRQEETPDGVVIDLAADDSVVGLEVLAAWAPFDWRSIVRDYGLKDADAESLEFLTLAMLALLPRPRREPSAPLVTESSPTGSSTPARVVSAA